MRLNKIYTAISVIIGISLLFEVYWRVDFIIRYVKPGDNYYLLPENLINNICVLLGIAGLIIFAATKFKSNAIIRFYMGIQVINTPLFVYSYWHTFKSPRFSQFFGWEFTLGLIITVAHAAAAIAGFWLLARQRRPKLNYIMLGGESFAEFSPASVWKRMANYLIDSIMVFYAFYSLSLEIRAASFYETSYRSRISVVEGQLMALGIFFLYYIVFEGIFKATPGKVLTNTVMADESGNRPGFFKALGRTLCRFIPFDPLSFFSKSRRGWHDKVTDTYVVAAEDSYKDSALENELDGFLSEENNDL